MRTPLRVVTPALVLLVSLLAAWGIWRSFVPATPAPQRALELPPADTTGFGDDVVDRALALAGADSLQKTRWVDDIPDLELAALSEDRREVFLRIANGRSCTCGCGYTLAACRRWDTSCDVSGPRARALYDSVRAGRIRSAEGFRERPRAS
ncbi:MAG: hypothetical protein ACKOC6_04935 [bacterium]